MQGNVTLNIASLYKQKSNKFLLGENEKNRLINIFIQGTFTYIPTQGTNRINNARLSKIMPQIKLMFPRLRLVYHDVSMQAKSVKNLSFF